MTTHARVNRGIYSCGNCGTRGHTRDTCDKPDTRRPSKLFIANNDGYRENRKNGLCDGCGVKSKRHAYCKRCRERKRARPSRQRVYRRREKRRAP